jgi:putative spermidine/putrescine transport system ATP-binding protein
MITGDRRMKKPLLDIHSLRKVYGGYVAVDHATFSLKEGEFLTLLGPSGSGKTTTLQMIAGLTNPSAGSIDLDGKPLVPLPAHKRNIGVVFQNYALFPHLTVAKNIAFPLEARRVGRAEIGKKVADVLDVVGLPGLGARYPFQLSGGQQQRVALARAMVFQPRLLLMDEPLGALDKKLREQIQLEIIRLHQELGITIIYVTHDQEEALVMSDRIAVFNNGRIEQLSTPIDIYENPRTVFIADFIGDSNFIPVSIRARERDTYLVDGPTALRGRAMDDLSIGDRAMMVVRPERIQISARANAEPDLNAISGKVKSVIYLGKSRKYVILADSGQVLVALEQCVIGHNAPVLNEGAEVMATWSAEQSVLLSGARA